MVNKNVLPVKFEVPFVGECVFLTTGSFFVVEVLLLCCCWKCLVIVVVVVSFVVAEVVLLQKCCWALLEEPSGKNVLRVWLGLGLLEGLG